MELSIQVKLTIVLIIAAAILGVVAGAVFTGII